MRSDVLLCGLFRGRVERFSDEVVDFLNQQLELLGNLITISEPEYNKCTASIAVRFELDVLGDPSVEAVLEGTWDVKELLKNDKVCFSGLAVAEINVVPNIGGVEQTTTDLINDAIPNDFCIDV